MKQGSKKKKNFSWLIENVINKQLCCGCGTCVGVCPTNAIDFRNNNPCPEWSEENKCNDCHFCANACPGMGFPLDSITEELRKHQQKYDADIGNYMRFLVGHSTDEFVRLKSASGGIATSLLIYALDKKIVDKVIVVVNDKRDIAKPIIKITNSKEDVIASMQSKYIQVPLNKVLNEILKSDCRFGIVGLPCHLEGLYLAQKLYQNLSRKIVFQIGLFCGYNCPYESISMLLNLMKIKKDDIDTFLGWREGPIYPGRFSIKLRNGDIASLDFSEWHDTGIVHYGSFRCFVCIDGLSQLADISLGDAADYSTKDSSIISRTEVGNNLLESAKRDGYIECNVVGSELIPSVVPTVPFMVQEKRYKPLAVIEYLRWRKVPVPEWDIKEKKMPIFDRINGILRIELVILIRKRSIAKLIKVNRSLIIFSGEHIYRLDVNPKRKIIGIITRFLEPHKRLKELARTVYHYK